MRSSLGLFVALSVVSTAAVAQNDVRIVQLGPGAGSEHFQVFAKELGAALTSVNLTPPETLGHAGWAFNVELGVANMAGISPQDTDGDGVPDNELTNDGFYFPTAAPGFEGRQPLLLPSFHVRKGFPFSFELGTRLAWIDKSQMFAGTLELKWAVNEGFAYLPDVGIRLHTTRAFNTQDFELSAGGMDVGVGKQFAIGGMVTLTPYVGWNLVFVGASTTKPIDFTPGGFGAGWDGRALLDPTATEQYATVDFFSNSHNRFYAGLRFVGGIVQLGAELSYSLLGTIRTETAGGAAATRPLPGVFVSSITLGLDY